jgi:hypothetical protein
LGVPRLIVTNSRSRLSSPSSSRLSTLPYLRSCGGVPMLTEPVSVLRAPSVVPVAIRQCGPMRQSGPITTPRSITV